MTEEPIGYLHRHPTEESDFEWYFDSKPLTAEEIADGWIQKIIYEHPAQPDAELTRLKGVEETFLYNAKWIERGMFCKDVTASEALGMIAHHPGMPWKNGRWDVDHKPYAAEFYKKFPKAAPDAE